MLPKGLFGYEFSLPQVFSQEEVRKIGYDGGSRG